MPHSQNEVLGCHRIEKLEGFESVSVQGKCVVFGHPYPAGIHVNTWKNVIVERPLVRTVKTNSNRDIRGETCVKTEFAIEAHQPASQRIARARWML